jgi:hypothetical protein
MAMASQIAPITALEHQTLIKKIAIEMALAVHATPVPWIPPSTTPTTRAPALALVFCKRIQDYLNFD